MMEEKIKKLGFKLKKEYVYGEKDEYICRVFIKEDICVDLNYIKKTGKLDGIDFEIKPYFSRNITFSELKQLDKILNKTP